MCFTAVRLGAFLEYWVKGKHDTGRPGFIVLLRHCLFDKLKVCGSPSSNSIGGISLTALACFVSLCQCHILVILTIVQAFLYDYICYGICDQ